MSCWRLTNCIDLASHSAVITAGCPPASATCKHVLPYIATPTLNWLFFSYFLYDYIDIFRRLACSHWGSDSAALWYAHPCCAIARWINHDPSRCHTFPPAVISVFTDEPEEQIHVSACCVCAYIQPHRHLLSVNASWLRWLLLTLPPPCHSLFACVTYCWIC